MRNKTHIALALLLFIATGVMAQEAATGYNPFVPANLDDAGKLTVNTVVEGSYHRYWLAGDPNYTKGSTFVWYVENGAFGTYDAAGDVWTPITPGGTISNGHYIELPADTIGSVANSSQIWVKWNTGSGGSTGYIAVYERSNDQCILDQHIQGFKHNILMPPEVWFAESLREECSDQAYTVELHFNNIDQLSYPYTVYYNRPTNDGSMVADTLVIENGMLTASFTYFLDFELVRDLDVTVDEEYTIALTELRDKYGSLGKIAPLGTLGGQYANLRLRVLHLPQTRQMQMN